MDKGGLSDNPGVTAPFAEKSVRHGLALALAEHWNSTTVTMRERSLQDSEHAGAFARLYSVAPRVSADERYSMGLQIPSIERNTVAESINRREFI